MSNQITHKMGKITPIIYTGEQFRRLRSDAGISQKELSELSKVTQGQISNFESGKSTITLETAGKLLTALETIKTNQK